MAETVEEKAARLEGRVTILQWLVSVLVVALIANLGTFLWREGTIVAKAEAAAEEKIASAKDEIKNEIDAKAAESAQRAEGFRQRHEIAAADRKEIRAGQQQIYNLIFMAVSGKAPPQVTPTPAPVHSVGSVAGGDPDATVQPEPEMPAALDGPLQAPDLGSLGNPE
jgi:hypothetical protein